MKQKILTLTTLITITFFVISCGGGEAVELKLNVAKGDVFACKVKIDTKINTSTMGMKMNIDQIMETEQTLTVENINANGNITFKNVMDRFYMKQSMPMMGMPINVEYDTDKPENKAGAMGESLGQYFSKMKGLAYQIEMDAHGKIISSNMEEIYKSLGLDSLSQKGGSENGGNNWEQYMSQLPNKAIKEGDTYTANIDATDLSPLALKNTYTVKEITTDLVILDVKSEFLPNAELKQGMSMEIKGDQTGIVEIDRKTGMTLKSEIKQNLDMTVSSDGMKIPMKSNGTITFTCVKK